MAYAQGSSELTAGDVLNLPQAEQKRLIGGMIGGMGALLQAYGYEDAAQCVYGWPEANDGRNRAILAAAFKQYSDQNPAGIVIALLRRSCGDDLLPYAGEG